MRKDLEHLRHADDAAEHGDVVPSQTCGLAAAVPVFVHGSNRGRRGLRQTQAQRDRRAAIAANLEELFFGPGANREAEQATCPLHQGLTAPRELQRVARLLGEPPPVAHPDRAFDLLLVAAEQLVHARRVARAAGILQEQRVEQIAALPIRQAHEVRQAHPNQARSRRVPLWVAFGDVEGA